MSLLIVSFFLSIQFGCTAHNKTAGSNSDDKSKTNAQSMVVRIECQPQVEINRNDTLIIQLIEYPGRGYSWSPGFDKTALMNLKFIKATHIALTDADGAAQKAEFEFAAEKKGEEVLKFLYFRPWEKNKPAADSCIIRVIIK
jgi:predicted secreted protein